MRNKYNNIFQQMTQTNCKNEHTNQKIKNKSETTDR